MKERRWGAFLVGSMMLLVPMGASSQPTSKGSPAPTDGLSAAERLEKATVPPENACDFNPELAEKLKQDEINRRNMDWVPLSDSLVKDATEIAKKEWAARRAALKAASEADMEQWRNGNRSTDNDLRQDPRRLARWVLGQCPVSSRWGPCSQPHSPGSAKLFSKVRGRLIGGRTGATLLLAGASNVPITCFVDVHVRRDDTDVVRKGVLIRGAGQRGGIVREISMGLAVDPSGDHLDLEVACVPRFTFGDGAGR